MKLKTLLWSLLTIAALSFAGCSDDDDPVAPQPQPELSFMFEVNNLTATSADLKITPSANDITYGASTLPAAMLDKAGEEEVINAALKMIKPEELLKGVQTIKAEELTAETEYIIFAVGIKDGKATSKLGYKRFTTLKDESVEPEPEVKKPVVELEAMVGMPDGSAKDSGITMVAKCTSKNASYAAFSVFVKEQIDAFLKENHTTIEDFMKDNANNPQMITKFDAEWMKDFNLQNADKPEGLVLMFEKLPSQTNFSVILDTRNEAGRVVVRKEVTTAEGIVKVLNTESFRKLVWDYETNASWKYEGELPCVIDFFATWCGPCKAFAPTFHKLAGEYEGSIIFYQIDVDQSRDPFLKMAQMGGNAQGGIPFFCFAGMEGAPYFKVGGSNEAAFRNLLDKYCLGGKTAVPFKAAAFANFGVKAVRAN